MLRTETRMGLNAFIKVSKIETDHAEDCVVANTPHRANCSWFSANGVAIGETA